MAKNNVLKSRGRDGGLDLSNSMVTQEASGLFARYVWQGGLQKPKIY